MLSSLGIFLPENGITLAIESIWNGAEGFTFFEETGLGKFHTKELTLPVELLELTTM